MMPRSEAGFLEGTRRSTKERELPRIGVRLVFDHFLDLFLVCKLAAAVLFAICHDNEAHKAGTVSFIHLGES